MGIIQTWDSILATIASSGGTTEVLRLLFSLLIVYPLAIVYRKKFYSQSPTINHLYILTAGISICLFNYGWQTCHSLSAVLVSYSLIVLFNGTALVVTLLLFNMGYLLVGYYATATESYDIKWTMPQCVLTLRLIGLAFNISDGQRDESQLSAAQKELLVKCKPSLLEVAAFAYFPATFLVGPQFSFRRFLSFINKEFDKHDGYMKAGVKRAAIGFWYLIVYAAGSEFVNENYVISNEFSANHGILMRMLLLGLWIRLIMYKYVACWLFTEGAATCFGITFAGVDTKGVADWSGCSNVKLKLFENTLNFQHYIDSYNTQTNRWIAEYVFKRLRFLGNRNYSHFGSLIFVALWHGLLPGFYITFTLEFAVMVFEGQMAPVFTGSQKFRNFAKTTAGKVFIWAALRLYTVIGMGFCVAPMIVRSFDKSWALYRSVWFFGYFFWLPWPVYIPVLMKLLGSKKAEGHSQ